MFSPERDVSALDGACVKFYTHVYVFDLLLRQNGARPLHRHIYILFSLPEEWFDFYKPGGAHKNSNREKGCLTSPDHLSRGKLANSNLESLFLF